MNDPFDEPIKSHVENGLDDDRGALKSKEKPTTVFLTETFYITTKKNSQFEVKLTEKGICLRKESNGMAKEQVIYLKDIIGCRCLRSKRGSQAKSPCACSSIPGSAQLKVVDEYSSELDETDISAYLYIYAYILKKFGRRGYRREKTTLTLRFRSFDCYEDNNREAQKWRACIMQLIKGENPEISAKLIETRRILIMLNPKSGSGKAREIFQQKVAPMFAEAEVSFDLQVTKRAFFAREYIRTKDIYTWRGIVVVGGDGMLWEVINGLLERPDWQNVLEQMPLGIIPCGSGNGLAKTIAHLYNEPYEPKPTLGAALAVIRGQSTPMDLVRVETRSEIMFSFLSVGWGLIADIDIESEPLRPIGAQRFTVWSLHRLISLRTYRGKLSYIPANSGENNIIRNGAVAYKSSALKHSISCNTTLDCPECHGKGDCETCDMGFDDILSLETSSGMHSFRPRGDSWYSATSKRSAYFSVTESVYQSVGDKHSDHGCLKNSTKPIVQMFGPSPSIPALTAPVPETWNCEEGDFVMVHAAYQTHLGSDCYFAPPSKLNDGIIWLLIIRAGATRSQLLSFLLGLSSGTHIPEINNRFMEFIPVTGFRIEPIGTQGNMTVDGESVEYGPIQGEIFPGVASVMVPTFS